MGLVNHCYFLILKLIILLIDDISCENVPYRQIPSKRVINKFLWFTDKIQSPYV